MSNILPFRILLDPAKAPRAFERTFRLHLSTGRDRNVLLQRFAAAVERDINDNLDSRNSPFSYIGGAGLHYEDASGCRRPDPGPEEDRMALDLIASSIPGLAGEWLDTNDVQGYLHERGIKVDGSASYIHASIPIDDLATPPEHAELDAYLQTLSRHMNFEDIEQFHRRFLEPESGSPISMPRNTHKGPDLRAIGPLIDRTISAPDLGDLTTVMNSAQPDNFFALNGAVSYEPHVSSPSSSSGYSSRHSFDGNARSNTFSPTPEKADSVSSAEDIVFSHLPAHQQKTSSLPPLSGLGMRGKMAAGTPGNRGDIWNASCCERLTVTLDSTLR